MTNIMRYTLEALDAGDSHAHWAFKMLLLPA